MNAGEDVKAEAEETEMQATQNGDGDLPTDKETVNGDQMSKRRKVVSQQEPEEVQGNVITRSHIEAIVGDLTGRWKDVAKKLRFPDDDIQFFESETNDTLAQARKMLILWMVCTVVFYIILHYYLWMICTLVYLSAIIIIWIVCAVM